MSKVVLDATALLAYLNAEAGQERVHEHFNEAAISAVNLAEVIAKLRELGKSEVVINQALALLDLEVIAFDEQQAVAAGFLRPSIMRYLSLGDRACLALARALNVPALTADRRWSAVPGFEDTSQQIR